MKRIDINNQIFSSDEFQRDKYKFYLIIQNLKSESVVLYSDEENYVICRGEIGRPTWIWTKDSFDVSKLKEIEEVVDLYLTDDEKDKFTCKKELYDLLVTDGFDKLNAEDYFEMGFLCCRETKKPRECDGFIDVPTVDDKATLVKYWYDDSHEMDGVDPVSMEKAATDVQRMLDSNKFYVWRNDSGKIVCMVNYTDVDGQAKLAHVYTPIEERGKGYATNLICQVTNIILEKGLVPVLYTDYNYIPSNRAYINAGFEDKGILINFSCSKYSKEKKYERNKTM